MWSCSDLTGSVETDRISNEVLYTQVWSVWRCYCRHLMDPGYCLTVREWERGEYSPETSVCPSIFSFSSPSYLPSPFVVTLLPLLSPFSTSSQAGRGSIPGCSVHYHPETVACDSNCQWLAQASHFSVREVMHTLTHTHTHTLTHTHAGAILSAKANSDGELHTARKEARRVIHALHKSQEKNDTIEVRSYTRV